MPHQFTAEQAANPATPLAVLADIATRRPDLRPLIAANPATYPELLDWLRSLGDPTVLAVLDRRAAGVVAGIAPPGLPPVPPPPGAVPVTASPTGSAQDVQGWYGTAGAIPSVAGPGPAGVVAVKPRRATSRRTMWTVIAAVTVVGLGGAAFAANALWFSKVGGASTPDEAVVQMIEGLVEQDVVSIYGVTSPAEFSLVNTTNEVYAKHVDALSTWTDDSGTSEALVAYLDALDLSVDDLQVSSRELEAGLAKVTLASGTLTVDADMDVIADATVEWFEILESGAFGDQYGSAGGSFPTESEIRDELAKAAEELPVSITTDDLIVDIDGEDDIFGEKREDMTIEPFLMVVEEDGRWYVSPYLTALEYAADIAGLDRGSLPDDSMSGAFSSPEEAAAGFVTGIEDYLATGTTAELATALPLAERRVFSRYGTLTSITGVDFAEFQEVLEGVDVSASYSVRDQDGDVAWLVLDELTVSGETDGQPFTVTLDSNCFAATVEGEKTEGCTDQVPLLGELGVDDLALIAVKEDGAWYISGSATVADGVGLVLANLQRLADEGKLDNQDWLDDQLGDAADLF